ncbi:Mitochondrial N [Spathaspora sp. JA1]|nr:Mitochondrial N [Spathaspora sp. JA1]
MTRLSPRLIRQATRLSPLLAPLLRANRTIESAQRELNWIRQELPSTEWISAVQARKNLVPLQYILGNVPFGDLTIECRPGVLIPRPETEAWVIELSERLEGLLNKEDEVSIVDACTGTGCIPLLLSHKLDEFKAKFAAFDVSGEAVTLANDNKIVNQENGSDRVEFTLGDVFNVNILQHLGVDQVDLVTANPPYIPLADYEKSLFLHGIEKSVKLYEPKLALIGEYEFYLELLQNIVIPGHAKAFVFEIGYEEQAEFVREYLKEYSAWRVGIWCDYSDNVRCVVGWNVNSEYVKLQDMCHHLYQSE